MGVDVNVVEWPGGQPVAIRSVEVWTAVLRAVARESQKTLALPHAIGVGAAASLPWGTSAVLTAGAESVAVLLGPAHFTARGAHLKVVAVDPGVNDAAAARKVEWADKVMAVRRGVPRPHRTPLASRDRRGVPPASGLPWSRVLLMVWSGECSSSWYGLKMRGFEDAFERNPKTAGGELVLRGTRVPLRSVLASLAEGCTFEEILRAFPTLTREQLRDAVAFAASSALKDLPRAGSGERGLSDASGRLDDDEHERLEAAFEEALGSLDEGGPGAPAEEAASPLRGPFR